MSSDPSSVAFSQYGRSSKADLQGLIDAWRPDRLKAVVVDSQIGICATPGRKNVADALQAIERLRAEGVEYELVVVDSSEPPVQSTGVHYVDRLSRANLFKLFRLADVFLFLSRSDSFGFTLLEAMKCGMCCVAAQAPSLPAVGELIEHGRNGFLVPFRQPREFPLPSQDLDIELLVDILRIVASDPGIRDDVGAAAAEEFSSTGRFSPQSRDAALVPFVDRYVTSDRAAKPEANRPDNSIDGHRDDE